MQWWCSANSGPWTWTPVAYPGVWLFVLVTAALYWKYSRAAETPRGTKLAGWCGVVLLWLSLDWPAGPLAAGYLASVHAAQFLIVALIAPPLILIGARYGLAAGLRTQDAGLRTQDAGLRTLDSGRWTQDAGLWTQVTHPLVAGIAFNIVVIATHVPRVNDALMPLQFGAFLVDIAWFVSGLWFWWPLIVPVPARPRFVVPLRMLYLFLGTLVHTGIAMVMLVYDHPMYGVYELAPRATGMSALTDLKVAGGIMELGGVAVIFGVLTVMFFKWFGGTGAEPRRTDAGP